MKKLLILLFAIILTASCTSPKFVVVGEKPAGFKYSCVVELKPINKAAIKLKDVSSALVDCEDYKVGDTIKINRREFANY